MRAATARPRDGLRSCIMGGALATFVATAPLASQAAPDTLSWRAVGAGVEWAEWPFAGTGAARWTRLVAVRLDPTRVRFTLEQKTAAAGAAPGWRIADAPDDALVALNAGQFTGASPWGWVVRDGVERLSPGRGPLSSAFVVTSDGRVHWIDGDSLGAWRTRPDLSMAFQSYPALLVGDGELPRLHARANRTQRDARLALGLDVEGRVLVLITRFDALGGALDELPLGVTVPEMTAAMRSLGARRAMLLDGGISAQLLLRTPAGDERLSGLRRVPLALIVSARPLSR